MEDARHCLWFRNVEHFKTAIYVHCGGLDLFPRLKPVRLKVYPPHEWKSTVYLIRRHPQHEFSMRERHFYHTGDAPVPFSHQVLIR